MLKIRLFCRSEYTNYFDAEIVCFSLLLELHEIYIISYMSLININIMNTKLVHFL